MTEDSDYFKKLFPKLPNLYEFMGLTETATKKEVIISFRSLTRILHPDRNDAKDAAEKFNVLKQANDILSDKKLRKLYNEHLEDLKSVEKRKQTMSARRKRFINLLKKREKGHKDSKMSKDKGNEEEEDLYSFMKKKTKTEHVETLFDTLNQSQMDEYLDQERKNKEELKKYLCTLKISWSKRYGVIKNCSLKKEDRKCFIEFSDFKGPEYAVKDFKNKEYEDLRVKYLIDHDRKKYLLKFKEGAEAKFELSSENLGKIIGGYNGYSYENKRDGLKREVERQRRIAELLEVEKRKVMEQYGGGKGE